MTEGQHKALGRVALRGAVLTLCVGLASCGKRDLVIPNVTHINGIPIGEYDPEEFDPKQDTVFSVASPVPVQASTVPVTAVATAQAVSATPVPEPEVEPREEQSETVDGAPTAGNITASTLVDGQPVEVTLMDAATTASVASQTGVPGAGALGATEADTAIRVAGIGAKDILRAVRGYAKVCDIGYERVISWINGGGRVTEVSENFDYLFWTDVCPGLAKYAQRR